MKKIILVTFILFLFQKQFSQSGLCYGPAQNLSFPANSMIFSKADFNNDGVQDICTNSAFGASLLLSNGTGSYTALTTFSLSDALSVVITDDFNNDGNADIAGVNGNSNLLYVVLGTGTGTILSVYSYSTGINPITLASADFNNDGNLDLAVANYSSNNVYIYEGIGDGTFSFLTNYNTGSNPYQIISGDFNNNGNADLLVNSSNSAYMLKGNGAGLFAVSSFSQLPASNLITKDMNNDSKPDLLYTNDNHVTILTANGNYTFNSPVNYSLNANYVSKSALYQNYIYSGLQTEDFNNDGKIDFACISSNTVTPNATCNIEIFYNSTNSLFLGPASFSISASTFFHPYGFIPVDVNNDGKLDLIATVDNDPEYKLLLNCNTVGIEENSENKNQISLYPNPANDVLNVNFNAQQTALFSKIRILNNLNQVVREEDLKNNSITIKDLPDGIYFLNLISDKLGTVSKRFVVSR